MIEIYDKTRCCGCNACGDVCPHHAIHFEMDNEGFYYPYVKKELCVNCGMCNRICPMNRVNELIKKQYDVPKCYAGYNKNINERLESTSGGIFSLLAKKMYKMGGYVGGAIYTDDFSVISFISNNEEDLQNLRKSKYIQGTSFEYYKTIKRLLDNQEKVLVCGLPCQMAALKSFLGKEYNNLLTIDILCKTCNSPRVFHKYLQDLENKYKGEVISVKERYKKAGWRSLTREIKFNNGKVYYGRGYKDSFQRGFQLNIFSRPSCYSCRFKTIPRIGDITLGDFWGIEKLDISLDDNKGTSLICINNDKGYNYFIKITDNMIQKSVSFDNVCKGNIAAFTGKGNNYPTNIDREVFFQNIDSLPFEKVANEFFPYSPLPIKSKIRKVLGKMIIPVKHCLSYIYTDLSH